MIDLSTDEDVKEILDWLAEIAPEQQRPYHHSRRMIERGHQRQNLTVLRHKGQVVSVALGSPGAIEIFGTHPDFRGRGFGGALAEHSIAQAALADVAAIELECVPEASLPFWQSLGFEEIDPHYGHNIWAMLRVTKQNDLPEGVPVEVVMRTFVAEALHLGQLTLLHEYRPRAVLLANQAVQLAERIVLHEPQVTNGLALVVEMTLNGKRLAFDQVEHEVMKAVGMRHDRFRQFFIDRIHLQPRSGAWIA